MLTTDAFRRLCRARDLLRETHDHTVPISQVAREAVMSPFHFIRQFQAIFGETPHQFRIRARLDRAKDLLALSDYSVTDVCMEVGFSSLGSFSDLFARRVGASPSHYRRQVRSTMRVPGVLPAERTPGCLTLMGAAFAIFEKQPHALLIDSDAAICRAAGPALTEESA
jgi:AraC-like DNA-binding protein